MTLIIATLCVVLAHAVPHRLGVRASEITAAASSKHSRSDPVIHIWHSFVRVVTQSRQRRAMVAALPGLVELIARSLRGGANLHGALTEAARREGPACESLRPCVARIDQGERLGVAVDRWATDFAGGSGEADVVRAVVMLGELTGGALAEPLERCAATLRERAALADEIRALTAQTRASSLVVALAPLGFLGVVALVDRDSVRVLFATPLGLGCLTMGLILDALGIYWMSKLASGVTR